MERPWQKVVLADECTCDLDCNECEFCEELRCPVCGGRYADCPCPGPTQDDLYEYDEFDRMMYARELETAEAEKL